MSEHKITPNLWFDDDAEQAIDFYVTVFPDAKVINRTDYPEGTTDGPTGLLTATIELLGQRLVLLNGGPTYARSGVLAVHHLRLRRRGRLLLGRVARRRRPARPVRLAAGPVRPLWQVVPQQLMDYLSGPDQEVAGRVMQAMLQMSKIEVAELDAAAAAGYQVDSADDERVS